MLTDHQSGEWERLPFKFDGYVILLTDSRVPRIPLWDEERLMSPENYILLGELKNEKHGVYGGWAYEESGLEVDDVLSIAGEDIRKRLFGVIKEHQFTLDAIDGLRAGNFSKFARAVNHSHDIMRDVFTLSCPEIDWLVKRIQEVRNAPVRAPVSCSRLTGKGFGHCTYTIITKADAAVYREKLSDYDRIFGYHPLCYQVEPSGGVVIHRI
jgi:galactokinase